MNEKLLLALYDRSGLGAYMPVDYKGQELEVEKHWEKFAELIIQECTEVTADWYKNHNQYHMPPDEHIKAHFGVE